MYVVTGATGKVGGATARALLEHRLPVAREAGAEIFVAQGSSPPGPRIEMIDGFNSGWIAFEGKGVDRILGTVTLDEALEALADQMLGDRQRAVA